MSKIDKQVVEMQFKNQQFESGAKKTISTLDKLKQALSFGKVSDNFGEISKAANNVDMNALIRGVDAIKNRFSTLGVIGMTVISNLTTAAMNAIGKVFNQLKSGGLTRALNIEQAKFMFEGLGMDVEASMASANAAVKGTAYGLDAAAKAASQLGASGMRAGDDMTSALRAIAGVAAMTGSEYEDISNIFTTVAGNGRLMGEQLLQFSGRGLNAAAELAKALGKSEEEVREMVSKGEISFEMFYKAMDNAFGAHAKDANKTFHGALSNMKAAVNRIGADIATPALEHLRDIFNALTPVIDNVHKALNPLIAILSTAMQRVSSFVKNFLGGLNFDGLTSGIKTFSIIADAAFTGLFNIFKNLGTILKPIKEAFAEVFPPMQMTSQEASKLANKIRDLTYNFKLNDEQAEKVKSAFESIFSVLKSFLTIASKVVSVVFKLVTAVGSFILGLKPLQDGILAVSNGIAVFVGNISDAVSSINVLDSFVEMISNGLSKIKEKINNFFSGVDVGDIGAKIAQTFSSITSAIGEFFNNGFDLNKLAETFKTIFGTGIFALVGSSIAKVSVNLSTLSNIVKRLFDNLANKQGVNVTVFNQLRSSLFSLQQNLNAGMLLKIAVSIGILALSLDKLAKIDANDLGRALVAVVIGMSELMASLSVMMAIMDGKSTKGLIKTATSLTIISAALLILAAAVKIFSTMSPEELAKGLIAVGVALAELAVFSNFVKPQKMLAVGTSVIGLAKGMVILAAAVAVFGSMDLESLAKGLGAVGVLLAEIAVFTNISANSVKILASAAALTIMSVAILGLAASLKIFATMSLEDMAKSLGTLAATLGILAAAMKVMGNGKTLVGSAALLICANSILVLAGALKVIGSMSIEQVAIALGALAGVFVVFGVAGMTLGPVIPVLLGLSGAIALFGAAVLAAGIGVAAFGAGLGMIAAAITTLGAGASVALTALISLIPMVIEQFGIGIQKLLGVIAGSGEAIFGAVTTIITSILDAIVAVAPKLLETVTVLVQTFCDAIVTNLPTLIATGMFMLISFLQGIAENIYQISTLVGQIIAGFITGLSEQLPIIIQAGFDFILNFINGLADAIRTNMPLLIEAVINLATSVIDGVVNAFTGGEGSITDTLWGIIQTAVDGIGDFFGNFLENGQEIINKIGEGIGRVASDIKTAIGDAIQKAVNKIGEFFGNFLDKGKEIINNIKDGIANVAGKIWDGIKDAIQGAIDKIGSFGSKLLQAGKDIIQGIIDGIKSMAKNIADGVTGVIGGAVDAFKGFLGIASPSKLFYGFGRFIDMGLANGLKAYAKLPEESTKTMSGKLVSMMSNAIDKVNSLTEDIDLNPTITPVLDVSSFNKSLDSMLSTNKTISIGSTATKASRAFSSGGSSSNNEKSTETINNKSYQFIQNNYSPKALNRSEIYRQTNNQFARFKEMSAV